MKLLLHTCCAPCLIHPLSVFRKSGCEVTGFFFNPNIYPLPEYQDRRMALIDYSSRCDVQVFYPEYAPSEFFDAVTGHPSRPLRCETCWTIRLQKTAEFARMNGFNAFSTTLLVSPYQDQEALKRIGYEIEKKSGIFFRYEDFRPGFKKAQAEARSLGLYRQKYCGCRYSQEESGGKKG